MTTLTVEFYQKPGCINNRKQLNWLKEAGLVPTELNLLTHAWNPERLRPFFADKPVVEWFNKTAPAVKQGEVDPAALTEEEALVAMCDNPILIRRPLIHVPGETSDSDLYMSGFDLATVLAACEAVAGQSLQPVDLAAVPDDLETCPKTHSSSACEPASSSPTGGAV